MDGLQKIILNKKAAAGQLPPGFSAQAHKLHVLIKPNDDSRYDDLVAVLDEMNIADVPYFAIVDITPEEQMWLKKK